MENWTIETAVRVSLEEADRKEAQGLLHSSGEDFVSTDDGDSETIYSIASCNSQFVDEDKYEEAESAIIDALVKKYPEKE